MLLLHRSTTMRTWLEIFRQNAVYFGKYQFIEPKTFYSKHRRLGKLLPNQRQYSTVTLHHFPVDCSRAGDLLLLGLRGLGTSVKQTLREGTHESKVYRFGQSICPRLADLESTRFANLAGPLWIKTK